MTEQPQDDRDLALVEEFLANRQLNDCLEYLLFHSEKVDGKKLTQEQIADKMGISKSTLYNRIEGWMRDGTMQKARQKYLIPKAAAIYAAIDRAIHAMPDMIDTQIEIALDKKNPAAATKAFVTLVKDTIQPNLEAMVQVGDAEEEDHINTPRDYDNIEP